MDEVRNDTHKYMDYITKNGALYRHMAHRPGDQDYLGWKLCVPTDHRPQVLKECHDAPTAGHLEIRKTIHRIGQRYYWPGMFCDVFAYVRRRL